MADVSQEPVTAVQNESTSKAEKPVPISRLSLAEVDAALAACEKIVRAHSDIVKAKLTGNAAIPSNVLRELSRANVQKSRLVMRRISLLVESGDATVMDLLDKLVKVKTQKGSAS